MPAKSKSQQRLFGMVHAFNKGGFHGSRSLRNRLSALSKHISDTDAKHFAQTPHKGLPEKKAEFAVGARVRLRKGLRCFESGKCGTVVDPTTLLDPVEEGRSAVKFDNGRIYTHPNEFLSRVEETKEAQIAMTPDELKRLSESIPPGLYAEMAAPRSRRRRSLLGQILRGTAAGTAIGGLGAGAVGAFLARKALATQPRLSPQDVSDKILATGLRTGLWGAGKGALVGAITGLGLNILDKIRGD